MKFVPMRDFRIRPGRVLKDLVAEGRLIVTSRGQPVGMMTAMTGATLEESVLEWHRQRGLEAFRALAEDAKQRKKQFTDEEIDAEIQAYRRAKRARS